MHWLAGIHLVWLFQGRKPRQWALHLYCKRWQVQSRREVWKRVRSNSKERHLVQHRRHFLDFRLRCIVKKLVRRIKRINKGFSDCNNRMHECLANTRSRRNQASDLYCLKVDRYQDATFLSFWEQGRLLGDPNPHAARAVIRYLFRGAQF